MHGVEKYRYLTKDLKELKYIIFGLESILTEGSLKHCTYSTAYCRTNRLERLKTYSSSITNISIKVVFLFPSIRDMVFYILVSLFQTAFLGTYSTVLCIHAVSIHVLVYLAQTPYSICSNSDNTV